MNEASDANKTEPPAVTIENKSEDQQIAEAEVQEFRKELGPFVVAAETTRMPMVFTDAKTPDHPIIFANAAFLKLTGYSQEEILAKTFSFVLANDTTDQEREQIEATFADADGPDIEIRCQRKDGKAFWASLLATHVLDENGDLMQHFASIWDLSRHRRERNRLQFLLDELNHRTQNMLATVQAIAGQTLRGKADIEALDLYEGRLLALSDAYAPLGREGWDRLNIGDVIKRILQPFGLDDRRAYRFSLVGDDVGVGPKAALALAMIFHELLTNAVKYGALSTNAGGHVAVAWSIEGSPGDEQVRLSWQERGGPSVTPPTRKGFGSRLVLFGPAQDLGGEVTLTFDPAGVVCEIVIPGRNRQDDLS